jgi:uncharacterized protein YlxP (DUF503 family)
MSVGVLQATLFVGDSGSLKSKRRIVKSIKDQVRHKFNVSIAEVAAQDLWQRAEIEVAAVGTDGSYVRSVLNEVVKHIQFHRGVEILDYDIEIL